MYNVVDSFLGARALQASVILQALEDCYRIRNRERSEAAWRKSAAWHWFETESEALGGFGFAAALLNLDARRVRLKAAQLLKDKDWHFELHIADLIASGPGETYRTPSNLYLGPKQAIHTGNAFVSSDFDYFAQALNIGKALSLSLREKPIEWKDFSEAKKLETLRRYWNRGEWVGVIDTAFFW